MRPRVLDGRSITTMLCDADGCLFPSEDPAFVASTDVTNAFLEQHGLDGTRTPAELRLATTGKNFRATALELAICGGVPLDDVLAATDPRATTAAAADGRRVLTAADLERWIEVECDRVTAYLSTALHPDPAVDAPLRRLNHRYDLAAVSSSALARLDACFRATRLDDLFPVEVRFSAEDSLTRPRSKPDPAIYRYAAESLGVGTDEAVAVEDSLPGVTSAVAAGFPVIGLVAFVAESERPARVRELLGAGAVDVVDSWSAIEAIMAHSGAAPSNA